MNEKHFIRQSRMYQGWFMDDDDEEELYYILALKALILDTKPIDVHQQRKTIFKVATTGLLNKRTFSAKWNFGFCSLHFSFPV